MRLQHKFRWAVLCVALIVTPGCDSATVEDPPGDEPKIVNGVSFDELFAEPTSAERQIVSQDWATRNPAAVDVVVVHDEIKSLAGLQARVRIVSHRVGAVLHYGAVITPGDPTPGSLPVLVYTHGGDGGVDLDGVQAL